MIGWQVTHKHSSGETLSQPLREARLTIIIFWKKRLWFAALKCVHNRLTLYNKCESAVVVDECV